MLLTKENYELILKYLKELGIRDVDFPNIIGNDVSPEDIVTLVHLNGNRKITILELLKAILKVVAYKDGTTIIEDTLISSNKETALSANMGKELNTKIVSLTDTLDKTNTSIRGNYQGSMSDLEGDYLWADLELSKKIDTATEKKADYTTVIKVGELDSNTDLTGLSSRQILLKILFAEYIPLYHEGTATISIDSTLKSVGDSIVTNDSFIVGGNKIYTSVDRQPNTYSGDVDTDAIIINSLVDTLNNIVTSNGIVNVTYTRTYANGTSLVVTNQGNNTNLYTLSQEPIKLNTGLTDNGTLFTLNDNGEYIIKGKTYTANISLKYIYPIWINNTKYFKDVNTYGEDFSINKAATTDSPLIFKLPANADNIRLYYYDNITNTWVLISYMATNIENISIGNTNYSVRYIQYTFADNSGERPYKLTFTI